MVYSSEDAVRLLLSSTVDNNGRGEVANNVGAFSLLNIDGSF